LSNSAREQEIESRLEQLNQLYMGALESAKLFEKQALDAHEQLKVIPILERRSSTTESKDILIGKLRHDGSIILSSYPAPISFE